MDITYLGHASFKLKGKDASVVCDPFDPAMVGINFPRVDADIVTVSHDHKDHNNFSAVTNVKRVINGPGEYEISGVSVVGISCFHDANKGELRGKNTIYVIEMDELRLAHLGDLGHRLTENLLETIGTIDILMIPVGGKYTIGSQEAVEMVHAIEPSITIPMHFRAAGMNEQAFGELTGVDAFLKEVGYSAENLPKLSVKKSDLLEDMKKIVVLEKR